MVTELVILGTGGHARVLLAALALRGERPVGCLAPTPPSAGWPADVAHLGDDERLADLDAARIRLVNGRGSTGATSSRRNAFERGKAAGFGFASVIHPTAFVADGVELGEGSQVMAGAIVQSGVRMGPNVLVNSGAVVDHDCAVGAHCHVASGASISGGVTIGDGVHIGTGAAVIQGIRIEDAAIVGAGAVVVRDVAAGTTVVGNPARVLRTGLVEARAGT